MNLKENVYETLKNGKPEAFVNEWEPFKIVFDPMFQSVFNAKPGQTTVDPWGVTMYWGENEPGAMPVVNDKTKVCPDITEWRKYVKAPDIENFEIDWTEAKKQAEQIRSEGKFVMVWMPTGLFEECHFLMGFEDTLVNFLMEPEDMQDLINYIADYKIKYIKRMIKEFHPDVIMFHDDWGSKTSLFMKPDTWREFFKESYKKIYSLMRENNVIGMHHADSFCEPIVKDMVEIGIDIWQGVLPQNDIQKIKKETDYKLTLMGGIDASIVDRKDVSEETVREEVRRACREYSEGGMFIPCLTYGLEGSIFPGVNNIIMDEVNKLNKVYFK